MVRIMGIDGSLTGTAVSILELRDDRPPVWIYREVLKSKLKGHARLEYIRQHVAATLRLLGEGDIVVYEAPSYGFRGGSAHEIAGLWWILRHEIFLAQAKTGQKHVIEVSPKSRAKYAAGSGNADKKAVLAAVRAEYPHLEIPDDNVADSVTLAAMGARYVRRPVDMDFDERLDAYANVEWPVGI